MGPIIDAMYEFFEIICAFDGNSASTGGAIFFGGGDAQVAHTTFTNNTATGSGWYGMGGAIYVNARATLTFTICHFDGNTANSAAHGASAILLESPAPKVMVDSMVENGVGGAAILMLCQHCGSTVSVTLTIPVRVSAETKTAPSMWAPNIGCDQLTHILTAQALIMSMIKIRNTNNSQTPANFF